MNVNKNTFFCKIMYPKLIQTSQVQILQASDEHVHADRLPTLHTHWWVSGLKSYRWDLVIFTCMRASTCRTCAGGWYELVSLCGRDAAGWSGTSQ